MAIKLRQGTISDAPVIARFIIEAMSEECCAHFYGPNYNINDFHAFMTSLAGQELTQYCYKNTILAQSDNDIAGIAVSYNGADLHTLRKAFIEGLYDTFHRDFRGRINDETQAGELYLDSLAAAFGSNHTKGRNHENPLLRTFGRRRQSFGPPSLPTDRLSVYQQNHVGRPLYEAPATKSRQIHFQALDKMKVQT